MKISCPSCGFNPDGSSDWNCQTCGEEFDMFEKAGHCTHCGHQHEHTACPGFKGGCDAISAHLEWYVDIDRSLEALGVYRDSAR